MFQNTDTIRPGMDIVPGQWPNIRSFLLDNTSISFLGSSKTEPSGWYLLADLGVTLSFLSDTG